VGLLDLGTGERVRVPVSAIEIVTCSPVWCRVRVVARSGVSRIDLMRPDGAERHRIAGGAAATASAPDAALLDRFEVMSEGDPEKPRLLKLYDETSRTTTRVAGGVGGIAVRSGVLWWSTGRDATLRWHALDLRTLA